MGSRGKVENKRYGKRRIRVKDKESDESDEDYTVGAEEEFEDSEDYCSSLAGEESEESLGEFEEEEEEEERDDDDDGDYDDQEEEEDEEEEEKMVKRFGRSKGRKGLLGRKKNGVGKARKRSRVSYKEECDEDYEDQDYKKRRVSYKEECDEDYEDEDYKKRRVSYKKERNEDYEDEDYTKRRVSYKEECDEDYDEDYKKRRVSYKEECDEDYEDEDCDNDDDEEFMPEEIDIDDEDELAVGKKNKVGRPPLWKKAFVKVPKRKRNSKVVKRPMRKKPAKNRGLQRKSAGGNEGAFIKKNPVVKERSKKNSGPRKRFVADSDFVNSGSSDFDYTISEEEREQVREASKFCGDLTISLRNSYSNYRLQEEGVFCQQRKRLGRKGKEKVEDPKIEEGKQVCGICFSEEDKKTIRGTLNCCSHYFCFACIMEWSKVESRCPLCKQRFVTISKPAKSNTGFDLRTVAIQVPERDQVYQPSEEELRGYLDPYENVICTECQQGGDDALMLLCDLCDSPAHTFCVGLGREVPEGNWYCEGCRPSALGTLRPQGPNLTPVQRSRSSPFENVREDIDLNATYVPETTLTQGTGFFSSPRHPGGDFQVASPVPGTGVLTVSVRRSMHHHIRNQIQHLLYNNRTSQLGGRTSESTTSGNNLLGSQIGRARELAFQHVLTPETLASQRRLQDNIIPSFQRRDVFPAMSSHSRDQLIWGQTSTSTDGSVNGMPQTGLAMGMGTNSRLGYEQLHPCSTRSNISDASVSPYGYREATVPSRTFQGTLHSPF